MEYQEEKLTDALVLARTRASDLESVKKLNFWGSDIENVSVVRRMPNLEVCSLSVNSITTLEDFSYCPNLQELYIRKNKIKDLSEINHLATLPRLRNLWLADNPCAETENYRSIVLKTLPTLQKLDNIVVTESERDQFTDTELLTNDNEHLEITGTEPTKSEIDDVKAEEKEPEMLGNSSHKNLNGGDETSPSESTNEVKDTEVKDDTEIKDERVKDVKVKDKEIKDEKVKDEEVKDTEEHSNAAKDKAFRPHRSASLDPVTQTWEETNEIRQELGLRPLPFEKITSTKPVPGSAMMARVRNN
ncbi:uncharacterized protein F09G8.5-like [Argopecten irradians]|uniref:uncharacterized protein F09G8.5-like n=1 Tax=Argopecten irradians TaxID=31199 RepID=UPI00371A77F1